ncbi:hypothetical protein HanPI659440_Chr01g0018931 [Helianthus annuus]|nr:hypothetical protein HanPI659440_Chr01g0018931 [Helianthus annuus]
MRGFSRVFSEPFNFVFFLSQLFETSGEIPSDFVVDVSSSNFLFFRLAYSVPGVFFFYIWGENLENVDAGGVLPELNWSETAFQSLLSDYRIPAEYGARYPEEGETVVDAPSGYVTLFFDFFHDRNFRLSLTVFMADLLEYYKIHISQLSPLGMVRARHFEYYFWSQKIETMIKHFIVFTSFRLSWVFTPSLRARVRRGYWWCLLRASVSGSLYFSTSRQL